MAIGITPPYKLTIENRPLYLYACVQSESISGAMVREYLREVTSAFRVAHYSRLLIKKETPTALRVDDFSTVANVLAESGGQGVKIAVVDDYPENDELNERNAVRARRRTGLEIQFFTSFAAGLHWLMYG